MWLKTISFCAFATLALCSPAMADVTFVDSNVTALVTGANWTATAGANFSYVEIASDHATWNDTPVYITTNESQVKATPMYFNATYKELNITAAPSVRANLSIGTFAYLTSVLMNTTPWNTASAANLVGLAPFVMPDALTADWAFIVQGVFDLVITRVPSNIVTRMPYWILPLAVAAVVAFRSKDAIIRKTGDSSI